MAIERMLALLGFLPGPFPRGMDAYAPTDSYVRIVRPLLPKNWHLYRSDLWFQVSNGQSLPNQGWKIHVSSELVHAGDVLEIVSNECIDRWVPFKFVMDPLLLELVNGKVVDRASAGKFITIYPRNVPEFKSLCEFLRRALRSFRGPYVLSDRRYLNSGCVYYRYGGIEPVGRVMPSGEVETLLFDPSGRPIRDKREPFFSPPSWIHDPFGPREERSKVSNSTIAKRYSIERPIHFSSCGGVYVGRDLDRDERVVLKEARPGTGSRPDGGDAVDDLRQEYEVLKVLEGTGAVPRAFDWVEEWEHAFLVEEFVEGITLRRYRALGGPCLELDPAEDVLGMHWSRLETLWGRLAELIRRVQGEGIVLSDLSVNNVMVEGFEDPVVRLIDLGGAQYKGARGTARQFTPGFAPTGALLGLEAAQYEDDWYAFGAIVLDSIFPISALVRMDSGVVERFLGSCRREVALPAWIGEAVPQLLSEDWRARPEPWKALERSRERGSWSAARGGSEVTVEDRELEDVAESTRRFLSEFGNPGDDVLFPVGGGVETGRRLNVGYGVCGVLRAIRILFGTVPSQFGAWLLRQKLEGGDVAPGLYVGLSGIAWTLFELGYKDVGVRMQLIANDHPVGDTRHSLFEGAAGLVLANVRFWEWTGDERFLVKAEELGRRLMGRRQQSGGSGSGSYWVEQGGTVRVGLMGGGSGVALALLFLSLATGDERYQEVGREALEFDLGTRMDLGAGAWQFPSVVGDRTALPYWAEGTAGILAVVVRYFAVRGEESLKQYSEHLVQGLRMKFSMPGYFYGASGIGSALLDYSQFCHVEDGVEVAGGLAECIAVFGVREGNVMGYPEDGQTWLSADYGSGASGVALFLDRLRTRGRTFDLVMDEMIGESADRG